VAEISKRAWAGVGGIVVGALPWLLSQKGIAVPGWVVTVLGLCAIGVLAYSVWPGLVWACGVGLRTQRMVWRSSSGKSSDQDDKPFWAAIVATALVVSAAWWWASLESVSVQPIAPITTAALKSGTARLIPSMRAFIQQAAHEIETLDNAHVAVYLNVKSPAERMALIGAHGLQRDNLSLRHSNEYADRFRAEAIRLRDAMLARLPTHYKDTKITPLYENPVTMTSIRGIADDLERLAKPR